jgi:hypothetical protein
VQLAPEATMLPQVFDNKKSVELPVASDIPEKEM